MRPASISRRACDAMNNVTTRAGMTEVIAVSTTVLPSPVSHERHKFHLTVCQLYECRVDHHVGNSRAQFR